MKYVIMIRSNPQPWGHPTSAFTPDYQAQPQEEKDRLGAHWDKVFGEADEKGEVIYGVALGDPAAARIFRYDGAPVMTDGPYAESKEHLAGFFLVDVDSQERAEELAECFSCPGDVIEVRPCMRPGSES